MVCRKKMGTFFLPLAMQQISHYRNWRCIVITKVSPDFCVTNSLNTIYRNTHVDGCVVSGGSRAGRLPALPTQRSWLFPSCSKELRIPNINYRFMYDRLPGQCSHSSWLFTNSMTNWIVTKICLDIFTSSSKTEA